MRQRLTLILGASLLCLALGCKKEREDAPRVPTSGGPYQPNRDLDGGDTAPDSSRPDAGGDAGVGPLARECKTFRVVDPSLTMSPTTGRYLNTILEPADFDVTRAEGTWEPTCARPAIRITLSDGKCPDGNGHQLAFYLDALSIENDLVTYRQNAVESETESRAIRIRYTRPRGLTPSGEWGTCGAEASGDVTFYDDAVNTTAGARFEATFNLFLPPCDGSDNETFFLKGSFDVEMWRGKDDACPE